MTYNQHFRTAHAWRPIAYQVLAAGWGFSRGSLVGNEANIHSVRLLSETAHFRTMLRLER
ncbi:hypothetical protein BDQ94DRAFT_164501 [Aspergillus welwitschiae]|uniref:Uncharacterized protein n=1 Tax=Aspergillus welwitschiae TaxID=1341132 RepID=A0A3F3PHJ0_9EURO|nr:hypothetical protein BDQ94DRAFT_164501 [Aspergillus welwitschiae]RDH26425.1 hypothetical protein BDQ94DRAFT_164501 [Aspergillus welwitschiae]